MNKIILKAITWTWLVGFCLFGFIQIFYVYKDWSHLFEILKTIGVFIALISLLLTKKLFTAPMKDTSSTSNFKKYLQIQNKLLQSAGNIDKTLASNPNAQQTKKNLPKAYLASYFLIFLLTYTSIIGWALTLDLTFNTKPISYSGLVMSSRRHKRGLPAKLTLQKSNEEVIMLNVSNHVYTDAIDGKNFSVVYQKGFFGFEKMKKSW
jgi:hypothetical protein